MADWSAEQYLKFEDERTRPSRDLLAQIPLADPQKIVDIGCGPGNSTELLVSRWPSATIIGIDTSADMLRQARERLPQQTFIEANVAHWVPPDGTDLLFANAIFQWVPGHLKQLQRLLGGLPSGGMLAVQIPDSLEEPAHLLIREVARQGPWSNQLAEKARVRDELPSTGGYYDALGPLCTRIEIWHTIYNHVLDDATGRRRMGQGHRLAAVPGTAGDVRAQAISRRIHRARRGRLSAAGRRQGAVPLSPDFHRGGEMRVFAVLVAAIVGSISPAHAADAAFAKFIASLWPEAEAAGVPRATFDAETKGLEPDYKLPDLILPGRPATGAPSQAEFVQVPADYIKEASIARLAEHGQKLMQQYRPALETIETRFKVPATIVLAIWGRETDYGRYTLPYDLVRVLATQAYVGRRKDQYRDEFVLALKMLGDRVVTRKDMRSSWAGATGLTQFLPSEYYKHGVDLDGDGKVDIWHSVPDALASAAQQLVNKGWQSGLRWAYEVEAPASADCAVGVPEVTKPIGDWMRAGFVPVRGQRLNATEQAQTASLLQPEGVYGPAFLTTKNYFVIKEYNFSDLYVLFVGHLSDRMKSPLPFATPWSASTQLRTADVEAMQQGLTRIGLYKDKIDGKAGMLTRAALGAYQKSAGLKVDCWPSKEVLRSINSTR